MIRWFHPFLLTIAVASPACLEDDAATAADELALAPSCSPDGDPSCLAGDLVDFSPAPGVQPECAVSVFLAADEEPLEHVVAPCGLTGGAPPCWQVGLDRDACPDTPTGLRLDVAHEWGDDVIDIAAQCVQRRPRRGR